MEIKLKKLIIKNFKGIREFSLDFHELITNVVGENGSGKTTLIDVFYWVLFNKDSSGRTDFGIKPNDANGNQIENLVNEGTVILSVDSVQHEFKKVQEENWVTRRGTKEKEFKGHEMKYYHNDVPLKLKDYNAVISTLIDEDVFKLITNPLHFNSLDWNKQLLLLKGLIEPVTPNEVLSAIKDKTLHSILVDILKSDRTFKQWRASNNEKIKDLTKSIDRVPVQINEVELSKPAAQNWEELTGNIKSLDQKKSDLTDKMLSANQSIEEKVKEHNKALNAVLDEQKKHNNKVFDLKMKRSAEVEKLKAAQASDKQASESELRIKGNDLQFKQNELQSLQKLKTQSLQQIDKLSKDKAKLLEDFQLVKTDTSEIDKINQEVFEFTTDSYTCPTCKRLDDTVDIATERQNLLDKFEKSKKDRVQKILENKKARLEQINQEGKRLNEEIEGVKVKANSADTSIQELNERIAQLESEIEQLKRSIEESSKSAKTLDQLVSESETIADIDKELEQLNQVTFEKPAEVEIDRSGVDSYKSDIAVIDSQIKEINSKLSAKQQIERAEKRIEELKTEETRLIAERAKLENMEMAMDLYEKTDNQLNEIRVNSCFELVKFSFLKQQINGGTKETCECSLEGVPFPDLNTASKIKAGIDIINTFSRHYNRYAPIFIDNRESVQHIPPTASQVINLLVPTNLYAFDNAYQLDAIESKMAV